MVNQGLKKKKKKKISSRADGGMRRCGGAEEGSLAPRRRHHLIFRRTRAVFHTSAINIADLFSRPWLGWTEKEKGGIPLMILLGPKTLNSLRRRRRRHLQSLASVSAVAATHTHHHCNKQPPHINSSHVIIFFFDFFSFLPFTCGARSVLSNHTKWRLQAAACRRALKANERKKKKHLQEYLQAT